MHIRVLNLHNNLPVNVKQPSICLHQLLKIVVVRFEIYFFFVLLPIVTILLWICIASDVSLGIFTQYHPTRPFRRAYDSVFFFISYFIYICIFLTVIINSFSVPKHFFSRFISSRAPKPKRTKAKNV